MPKSVPRVDLLSAANLIREHLTEALCEEVWRGIRTTERQRVWSLFELSRLMTEVTLDPPPSLSQALSEASGGRYHAPASSDQALFARCKNLDWRFFLRLFERLRAGLAGKAPAVFSRRLAPVFRRFAAVEAVDGSTLDQVQRRLKAVRKGREVPLGGALLGFLDLATGTIARLLYDPRVETAEFSRVLGTLGQVPRQTLLVGDRLYGVPKLFEALDRHGLFGVFRRHAAVKIEEVRLLSREASGNEVVEDFEVVAGSGQTAQPQRRLIRLKREGRTTLELLTNVLDPARLTAQEALETYRARWKVERLYSDLKEVLKLSRFYTANVNGVGIQVYAAAIVHTALKAAQGQVAAAAGIEPERISTKRFFPKMAAACVMLTGAECGVEAICRANRGVELKRPSWSGMRFAWTTLDAILVRARSGPRQRPKKILLKRPWRSLPEPPRPPQRQD